MNKILFVALISSFLLCCNNIFCHAEVVDKILVVVNDEVITQREIDRKISPLYEEYKTSYTEKELEERLNELYKFIIEQLINDKLVVSEAKRRGIEVSDAEINEEVRKVKSRFSSEEEFYLTMDRQGITLEELKKNYKSMIMSKKLIEQEITSRITMTPSEITEYYNAHKDEFNSPEMVKTRCILIKIKSDRGSEEALKISKEILERLKNGEDFSECAKIYSDDQYASFGGDMGYVKKGEMIKRIDEAIFTLEEGEISDIIRTDLGFHIFKVEEKKKPYMKSFAEVKEVVEAHLYNEKIQNKLETFIKTLRENAYIAYK